MVMPVTSAAPSFPWEKVTLLVEYDQSKTTPLFDGNLPKNLKQYIVLKSVQDVCGEGEEVEGRREGRRGKEEREGGVRRRGKEG